MPILDSLFVKLGYEYSEENLKKFNELASGTGRILKASSLAAIGLATSFALVFAKISGNALQQQRVGKNINLTRKEMEALKRTSEELTGEGGAGEELANTFFNIEQSLKAGHEPSSDFIRGLRGIGLSLNDFMRLDQIERIERFASGLQSLGKDAQDVTSYLLGIGGAQKTFLTDLKKGDISSNKPSDIDLAAIKKSDKLFRDVKQIFSDLIVKFGNPLLEKLVPVLEEFSKNVPDIVEAFTWLANKIGGFLTWAGVSIGETAAMATIGAEESASWLTNLTDTLDKWGQNTRDFLGVDSNDVNMNRSFLGMSPLSSSSSMVTQEIQINVNAADPHLAAKIVKDEINNSLRMGMKNVKSSSKN